jgi:prepilin-type N-terminal cleavage/methylation domain-containing protein
MKRNRRAGFTLMEVMVTVVVVGVAITVIAQGFAAGTRTAARVDRATTASLLAGELISKMETGEIDFFTETEGEFGDDLEDADAEDPAAPDVEGYRWRSEVEDGGLQDLYLVTITVYWSDSFDAETTQRFETVRYFRKTEEDDSTQGE